MSRAGDQCETGYAMGDDLLAYWRRMPRSVVQTEVGARNLPHRNSLNPADIKSLLPNIYLLERVDHNHTIVRLRGTWLDERVERPRDNYNLFEQYSEEHRESYKDFLEALVGQPCGAALRRQRTNDYGRSFCYHTSYFPMIGDGEGEQGARMFLIGVGWLEPLGEKSVVEDTPVLYEGAKFMGATWIDIGYGVPDSLFFDET